MDDSQLAAIRHVSEPVLAQEAAELVELTASHRSGQWFLRFLVDKVGGVTIHDCTRLNRRLQEVLDGSGIVSEGYTLEVSSPGLDRPLESKRDFERALGEQIQLYQLDEQQIARPVHGQVLAVQPEAIVVKTSEGNLTIEFGRIRRAQKVIRW